MARFLLSVLEIYVLLWEGASRLLFVNIGCFSLFLAEQVKFMLLIARVMDNDELATFDFIVVSVLIWVTIRYGVAFIRKVRLLDLTMWL